jgi:hypothetical protein
MVFQFRLKFFIFATLVTLGFAGKAVALDGLDKVGVFHGERVIEAQKIAIQVSVFRSNDIGIFNLRGVGSGSHAVTCMGYLYFADDKVEAIYSRDENRGRTVCPDKISTTVTDRGELLFRFSRDGDEYRLVARSFRKAHKSPVFSPIPEGVDILGVSLGEARELVVEKFGLQGLSLTESNEAVWRQFDENSDAPADYISAYPDLDTPDVRSHTSQRYDSFWEHLNGGGASQELYGRGFQLAYDVFHKPSNSGVPKEVIVVTYADGSAAFIRREVAINPQNSNEISEALKSKYGTGEWLSKLSPHGNSGHGGIFFNLSKLTEGGEVYEVFFDARGESISGKWCSSPRKQGGVTFFAGFYTHTTSEPIPGNSNVVSVPYECGTTVQFGVGSGRLTVSMYQSRVISSVTVSELLSRQAEAWRAGLDKLKRELPDELPDELPKL